MQNLFQQRLNEISQRIIDTLHPSLIYLYGSYAYGDPRQDSDIDLLIVVDASAEDTINLAKRAYTALRGLKMPVELNVVSQREFEERRHWVTSVERDAVEKGRQLHAA